MFIEARLGTKTFYHLTFFLKNLTQLLSFYFGCAKVTGKELKGKFCFLSSETYMEPFENPTNKSQHTSVV